MWPVGGQEKCANGSMDGAEWSHMTTKIAHEYESNNVQWIVVVKI